MADLFSHEIKAITRGDILSHRKSLQEESSKNLRSSVFNIKENFNDNLDMKGVSLSVFVEKLQYDNMSEFVDLDLQQSLQTIQLKKNTVSTENLLEKLDNPDMAGELSF